MGRRTRRPPWLSGCCYHLSNTCYSAARILRFGNARQLAVKRLREITNKGPVRLLDYLLRPDGYRLLVTAEHLGQVAAVMKLFSAATARHYRMRSGWEGPVWRPRYNITLVQKGVQAIRCALDMDFAMARTGNPDLFHPLLWKHSGHQELTEVRKRYRLIDRAALRPCFLDVPWERFREWYTAATNEKWTTGEFAAEPWWEEALVVGSRQLCEQIADTLPESWFRLCVYPPPQSIPELVDVFSWTVMMSRTRKRDFISSLPRA